MSKGIKMSTSLKRELYLSSRKSKNPNLKVQSKKQILTSYNKTRTTWNIVKSETEKKGKE